MARKSIVLRVPNAVLFISGSDAGKIPKIERGSVVWSTPTCIAVGCTPDVDGETKISIGVSPADSFGGELAFDGRIETPNELVRVDTTSGKKVLEQETAGGSTRIRIWVNHPKQPSDVRIVVG